jgi:hypothetical protein
VLEEGRARTNSFIGESIIVVLPTELGFNVAARSQALARFDNLQVGDFVEVDVSGSIEVFLSNQDTFYEKVSNQIQICGIENRGRRETYL